MEIKEFDLSYSKSIFLSYADTIIFTFFNSFNEKNLEKLKTSISTFLYDEYRKEYDTKINYKYGSIVESSITEEKVDGDKLKIKVKIAISYLFDSESDRVIDVKNPLYRGSSSTTYDEYSKLSSKDLSFWNIKTIKTYEASFEKSIKSISNEHMVNTCKSCGANVDLSETGVCSYCKEIHIVNANGWILTNLLEIGEKTDLGNLGKSYSIFIKIILLICFGPLLLFIFPMLLIPIFYILGSTTSSNTNTFMPTTFIYITVFSILLILFIYLLFKKLKRSRGKIKKDYIIANFGDLLPDFNEDEYGKMFFMLYVETQEGRANNATTILKNILSEDLFRQYCEEMEQYRKKEYKYYLYKMQLKNYKITGINYENNILSISIQFELNFFGYLMDLNKKRVISGSKYRAAKKRCQLTFAEYIGTEDIECPNCNAIIKKTNNKCSYCKTVLKDKKEGWVLTKKTTL